MSSGIVQNWTKASSSSCHVFLVCADRVYSFPTVDSTSSLLLLTVLPRLKITLQWQNFSYFLIIIIGMSFNFYFYPRVCRPACIAVFTLYTLCLFTLCPYKSNFMVVGYRYPKGESKVLCASVDWNRVKFQLHNKHFFLVMDCFIASSS